MKNKKTTGQLIADSHTFQPSWYTEVDSRHAMRASHAAWDVFLPVTLDVTMQLYRSRKLLNAICDEELCIRRQFDFQTRRL